MEMHEKQLIKKYLGVGGTVSESIKPIYRKKLYQYWDQISMHQMVNHIQARYIPGQPCILFGFFIS